MTTSPRSTTEILDEARAGAVDAIASALEHVRRIHPFAPSYGPRVYRRLVRAEALLIDAERLLGLLGASLSRERVDAGAARPPEEPESPDARRVLAQLRDWRRAVCPEGKPLYVVCTNQTLMEAALTRPTTLDELAELHGVGPAFLARHGESFLKALADDRPPAE